MPIIVGKEAVSATINYYRGNAFAEVFTVAGAVPPTVASGKISRIGDPDKEAIISFFSGSGLVISGQNITLSKTAQQMILPSGQYELSLEATIGGVSQKMLNNSYLVINDTILTVLPASASIVATAASGVAVNVVWAAIVGATSYRLERSLDGALWSQVYLGPNTTFSDTGLTALTLYYYRVSGSASAMETSPYTQTNITTLVLTSGEGYFLPSGGTEGQYLEKAGSISGATRWKNFPTIPNFDGSETKIISTTSVNVLGSGTIANPYRLVASGLQTVSLLGDFFLINPTIVSATVPNGATNTVVVVFSQSVTVTTAGWSFRRNLANWVVLSVAGSGTAWTFTMATNAANGETIDRSYNSITGNTLDELNNELVSFTNAAVTNSIAGSAIYLTFPSLPAGFETYNLEKGIRTTSGYTEEWKGIVANQTLAVGQRMVVKTDGIGKFSFFGISTDNTTSGGWSANTGGRQVDSSLIEAQNFNIAFSEAVNNNYFYSVFYESEDDTDPDNGIVKLQKSANGINWTTIANATSVPFAGAIYMKIFIYSASHGFSEIYKI